MSSNKEISADSSCTVVVVRKTASTGDSLAHREMDEPIRSPLEDANAFEEADETPESTLRGSESDRGYYADAEDTSIHDSDEVLFIPIDSRTGDIQDNNKDFFAKASALSTAPKLIFGLFIVVVIATTWVGSTQLAKSTYNSNSKFRAPFFLVWFGTSWMSVIFPLTVPFYFIFTRKLPTLSSIQELWSHSREIINPYNSSTVTFLTSTVLFSFLWVPTNYCFARALITIPATDVTALFSTAPAFVFLLSMFILKEPPLILRFLAVLLAVGGIVLFSYVNGYGSVNIVGVILSVGSAIGAALYKTLLKWRVKEASLYQMSLFLTSIGIFCSIVFWPLLLILHVTGVEILEDIPWGYLCGHCLLGVLFNFAINFGIAYTFPLFISLGTIMGIPINALVDAFLRHVDLLNWKLTGMDLIVGGFLLMLVEPSLSHWIQQKLFCCCRRQRCNYNYR